jgi:hypothetical protein
MDDHLIPSELVPEIIYERCLLDIAKRQTLAIKAAVSARLPKPRNAAMSRVSASKACKN